jgi:hypothetical protein
MALLLHTAVLAFLLRLYGRDIAKHEQRQNGAAKKQN